MEMGKGYMNWVNGLYADWSDSSSTESLPWADKFGLAWRDWYLSASPEERSRYKQSLLDELPYPTLINYQTALALDAQIEEK